MYRCIVCSLQARFALLLQSSSFTNKFKQFCFPKYGIYLCILLMIIFNYQMRVCVRLFGCLSMCVKRAIVYISDLNYKRKTKQIALCEYRIISRLFQTMCSSQFFHILYAKRAMHAIFFVFSQMITTNAKILIKELHGSCVCVFFCKCRQLLAYLCKHTPDRTA